MADDDEEDSMVGAYEGGVWMWNDEGGGLYYLVDQPIHKEETVVIPQKTLAVGAVQFKELDVIEQMRFRKRYMRKLRPMQDDVITLQDIKDIAIYTAPLSIMSVDLINMLHVPTSEKFIRALILYCQYYLQVAQEMSERVAALASQIRTPISDEIEEGLRDDLCDLRSLVAKEYNTIIIGGQDTRMYHHMGSDKKKKSLSDKDAHFFETFLVMCIQIVWLALGRRSFNQLELEINRLFKTEIFNMTEHRLKTRWLSKISAQERRVLLGHCALNETKLHTCSPLTNEVFCLDRKIDYRLLGLGSIQYDYLPPRFRYMLMAISGPEEYLNRAGVTVGILGKPRRLFDTALHLLPTVGTLATEKKSNMSKTSNVSVGSGSTKTRKQTSQPSYKRIDPIKTYGYDDIVLPDFEDVDIEDPFPPTFPDKDVKPKRCSELQRKRWQNRLRRLLYAPLWRQSAYTRQSDVVKD